MNNASIPTVLPAVEAISPAATPQQFLSVWRESFLAANSGAAYFDLSHRDELTLTGKDRQTFLHGFCTNDIRRLNPGSGCEAFVTTIKGKSLGHIFVFAEDDRLIIDTVPEAAGVLLPHLDRYLITEDVTLTATTDQRTLLLLTGPRALSVWQGGDSHCPDLQSLHSWQGSWRNIPVFVRRVDWFGPAGLLISCPPGQQAELVAHWHSAGVIPGDSDAWTALRIEYHFPLFNVDFSADYLVQEVRRTEQAVSFRKGCYLGQEPIARIDALGHVNREIRGLKVLEWSSDARELVGAELFTEATGPKVMGKITSAAEIPANDGSVAIERLALATVRREVNQPGQKLIARRDGHSGVVQVRE